MGKISKIYDEYTRTRKKIKNIKESMFKLYDIAKEGKVPDSDLDEMISNMWEFYAYFEMLQVLSSDIQDELINLKIKRRCKK